MSECVTGQNSLMCDCLVCQYFDVNWVSGNTNLMYDCVAGYNILMYGGVAGHNILMFDCRWSHHSDM